MLTVAGRAAADTIPKGMLDADEARCKRGCLVNNDAPVCTFLCRCTVQRFATALDLEAYLALTIEMRDGTLSPAARQFLDDTARACAAEWDAQTGDARP